MSHSEQYDKFIDIEKVIASKNPRLLKVLPRFIISLLKKILHEEDINKHLYIYRDLKGIDFIRETLKHFKITLKIFGLDNLTLKERILVASNHPLGGLDGMALMYAVHLRKPDFVFPVNDILLNLKSLESLFIPLNKHGANSKEAILLFEEMMASDKTILMFPAGLVSRKINGQIRDLEWKKTFVSKARQYNRFIIPTFIDGRNSNFFYNLANFRKRLKIKANIEMFFLIDEMYKQRNKIVSIYFDEPLNVLDLRKDMTEPQIAAYLQNYVYTIPAKFQNVEPYVIDFQTI